MSKPPRERHPRHRDKTIGNYVLTDVLGEGQFGKVRLGTHKHTGKTVAVKCIAKKKLTPRTVKMVQREVAIHKVLKHPHIAELYDVIETAKNLYLVMENCEGGEMYHYLVSNGKMDEPLARRFVRQMIMALGHCHHLNLAHRDLKLENVLLDRDCNVKITDFGFGNQWRTGSLLRTFCGSPNYAAPEIVTGMPYNGGLVDVWSLGVMVYVLVAGRLPYDSENVDELFASIRSASFLTRPTFSRDFRSFLQVCMDPEPATRWTMDQLRSHEWITMDEDAPLPPPCCMIMQEDVNNDIIDTMTDLGFDRLKLIAALYHYEAGGPISRQASETAGLYREILAKRATGEEPSVKMDRSMPPLVSDRDTFRDLPHLVCDAPTECDGERLRSADTPSDETPKDTPKVRVAVGVNALFACEPADLRATLIHALIEHGADVEENGWLAIAVFPDGLKLHVEVCNVPAEYKSGLRFKRMSANQLAHDKRVTAILASLSERIGRPNDC